ncbi:MAG: hypothetical protein LCI00_03400 [Chloroflexi bacterium]|nr:hypothetical protein [Chloroflexota bacterium]MCC6891329.1 hypothetical protein [Anaerolineae bacterium]
MIYIESTSDNPELSFRQRWNHYLAVVVVIVCIIIAVNLRDAALYAVTSYTNSTVGISALYPRNWLINTTGDYVFRVQDMSRVGFKTTIQVGVQAVSTNTSTRNIVDALTLNRSQTLAAYRSLPADNNFILPDGTIATEVSYTYTAINADPFLETIPTVVRGIDIITIKRGQAVIITFLTDSESYEADYDTFSRFLDTLEF